MKTAFTLIELTVAVAIMAMVLFFGSVIFKASIETHRTAGANAEIMQKLRAITDQLDRDLKGVGKGLPIVVVPDADNCSRIVFLANGDFQSVRQYEGKTVSGNLASIFYGPAANTGKPEERILARGQTILTADPELPDPHLDPLYPLGEYLITSLYQFKADIHTLFPDPDGKGKWAGGDLPALDPTSEKDLVKYMAKGVDKFTVQSGVWQEGQFNWSEQTGYVDPVHANQSGNLPAKALKFTFTLYDSKGIMKNGQRFTHIVYLGE